MKKIIVCGDIHADWNSLNRLVDEQHPDIILQVGDFGYWPNFHFPMDKLDMQSTTLYFCPGNHEDWNALDALEDLEIHPNIFYMPKGSLLTLDSGHNILFMGGAYSIDKAYRIPMYSWFPQEEVSHEDLENLPEVDIDIIISHTSPLEFGMKGTLTGVPQIPGSSQYYLSQLLERYKPRQWFFGHWHTKDSGTYEGTDWTCLDISESNDWWITLELEDKQ